MKKGLLIVAAVLMLAGAAQAGEVKLHHWPCAFVPQKIFCIPVILDVGYWIRVKDQTKKKIELNQISIHEYDGCITFEIEANFNATLSCTIEKFAANDITQSDTVLSCSVAPANIGPGKTNITVCAHITNANLANLPGGADDVQVATVCLWVVPTV
jgi:hypothetical protein